MEMAVVQLGGHPVYTRGEEVGFDVREPVEDIARIMAGYHAAARRPRVRPRCRRAHGRRQRRCRWSTCSATGRHPLQALADVLTMRAGARPARPAARSPTSATTTTWPARWPRRRSCSGMHVRLGCPAGYDATTDELDRARRARRGPSSQSADPREAVAGRRRRAHRHVDLDGAGGREGGQRMQAFEGYHGRRGADGRGRARRRVHALPARLPRAGGRRPT